ncbi:MAG: glycine dehydrogenase, partial [Muribaculaceae bacterium]|nr:glycine dehydrogenase [Muribaculaceae bacterium]
MSHHYFPHTPEDIAVMLERIGVSSLDDLYSDVPESLRLKQPYNLPAPQSEKEIRDFFDTLGDHNQRLKCFAG